MGFAPTLDAQKYVALCYSVILAAAITAHEMNRPTLAHTIKAFK